MIKIKVITGITSKRALDGTESKRFTGVTENNQLCMVYLARYKGDEDNIVVGNYLLLTDVVVTHKTDISFISLGVISKV